MPIQPIKILPGGGGVDAIGQILGTGVNVLQRSLDNAVTSGRAAADLQFRQETNVLSERERLDKNRERRNLERRRQFEADRKFVFEAARDERDFAEKARQFDLTFGEGQFRFDETIGVSRDRAKLLERQLEEVAIPVAEERIKSSEAARLLAANKVDERDAYLDRLVFGSEAAQPQTSGAIPTSLDPDLDSGRQPSDNPLINILDTEPSQTGAFLGGFGTDSAGVVQATPGFGLLPFKDEDARIRSRAEGGLNPAFYTNSYDSRSLKEIRDNPDANERINRAGLLEDLEALIALKVAGEAAAKRSGSNSRPLSGLTVEDTAGGIIGGAVREGETTTGNAFGGAFGP